jgi:phospholipase C
MFHPHTDMHPPGAGRLRAAFHVPAADSIVGGEQLLARIYDAIRTSGNVRGSHWANTLLLVTFDEHGGTFDHVPPPSAPAPDPGGHASEQGFGFDRLGVRVPTILISPWVDPQTVVHDEFRHTSMIRTLRERWSLGPPLTLRDAGAPDLGPLLLRATPRDPSDWPTVAPRALGIGARILSDVERAIDELGRPMEPFERSLVGEALAHEASVLRTSIAQDAATMSHAEAHRHMRRIGARFFPGVVGGRQGPS